MPWDVNNSGTVAGQYNGKPFYSTSGARRSPSPAPPAARLLRDQQQRVDRGRLEQRRLAGLIYNLGNSQLTQISMAAYGVAPTASSPVRSADGRRAAWRDAGGTIHDV